MRICGYESYDRDSFIIEFECKMDTADNETSYYEDLVTSDNDNRDDYLQPINTYDYEHVTMTSSPATTDDNYLSLADDDDEHYTPLTATDNRTPLPPSRRDLPELPPAYEPPVPGVLPTTQGAKQQQPIINSNQLPPGHVVVMMMSPGQQQPQPGALAVVNSNNIVPNNNVVNVRRPSIVKEFPNCLSLVLGVLLVCIGVLSMLFNIVDIAVHPRPPYYESIGIAGHGLWAGILCVVTGGFEIGSGRTKRRCLIVTSLVFGIFVSIACMTQFFLGIAGFVTFEDDYNSCLENNRLANTRRPSSYDTTTTLRPSLEADICDTISTIYVMEILLTILGAIGGVLCIVVSAVGCKYACCCNCCNCCCCAQEPNVNQPANYSYGVPVAFVNASDPSVPTMSNNNVIMPTF